jgi:L,D-peptidoglycan transpeptidase YkuD (ErfK/YbiS/YcfS/YnhG family)
MTTATTFTAFLAALAVLAGCAAHSNRDGVDAMPVDPIQIATFQQQAIGACTQALVVVGRERSHYVRAWLVERGAVDKPWSISSGPFPATVGAAGFAPLGRKQEGDKKTPTGAFSITETFGSDPDFKPQMPYKVVTRDDAWSEDPNSPYYNQWITGAEAKQATDRLAREDDLYVHAGVIDYNRWPIVVGAGSAIFLHKADPDGAGTLGCVGLARGPLDEVLVALDPQRMPHIIMGEDATLKQLLPAPPPRKRNRQP